MVGIVGRALLQTARFAVVFASLWLVLNVTVAPPQSVYAEDAKVCLQQGQSCGCPTCGCCGTSCGGGQPTCPAGFRLYDDYCLPDCPAGYSRYPGIPGLCLPPCQHGCPEGYDQVPLPECPENYVRDLRNPDRCIPDYDRIRNQDSCPDGMEYSSETGRCEFQCPDNFYRDENGRCTFAYGRECNQGYTRDLRTGKCVPQGEWPVTYKWVCLPQCPPGTYRDIRYPTRCVPPPPTCDEGFTNENGRCVPVCEPGTQRDRYGYCVPQRCPDGQYPDIRGRCRDPECPYNYKRDENGNCQPPETTCPQGTVSVRGQCMPVCADNEERDENGRCVPVDQGCRQGQEEVNGQCVDICKLGTKRDANGRCVPERQGCAKGTEPFKGRCVDICPQGTKRNADGRCVTIQRKCPEGTVRGKDGSCIDIPDEPLCPKGMRPDGEGGCERIGRPAIPLGCPDGFFYNKRSQQCERLRRPPPQTGQDDGGDFSPNDPPPIRRLNPQINPEILQQLIPRKRPNVQDGGQDCPDGMFRDKNGRCVQG